MLRFICNICASIQRAAVLLALVACWSPVSAQFTMQVPPPPTPDPAVQNVFYGAVNPAVAGFETPVIVFVPGLGGRASDWFEGNDMYGWAYTFGYRTAFISPNPDNTPATRSILDNAAVLKNVIPKVAAYYKASKMYFVGHSKGGLDLQAALVDPTIAPLVKAVFTISTPNKGTELADWAFANPSLAGPLNLLTPAVESMKVQNMSNFRSVIDPLFMSNMKKPFYHFTGNEFYTNPVTLVTGAILRAIVSGQAHDTFNDGLVTVARSRLSPEYANELGILGTNHFATDSGTEAFPKIRGRIQGIENTIEAFDRIAVNGFTRFGGSENNTWAWSAAWFKGKLYVGTAREALCVTLLTADIRTDVGIYNSAVLSGQCPSVPDLAKALAAEIWQYDPATKIWRRVFTSPNTIPITVNGTTVFTARDIGFRGMAVHREPDGTEALYVGGVTSGSLFEPEPFTDGGYPPPRLLRSTDGENFNAVPQTPGTFMGDIGDKYLDEARTTKIRSFRSLVSFKGQLFATVGSYIGSGIVVASPNPAQGDNSFRQVSPSFNEVSAWTLAVFNNHLYTTTGLTRQQDPNATGYAVFKTDASGTPPYAWTPVVTAGGNQDKPEFRAPNGLSFAVFRNELYVGTNRPTELIRIRPDDTWDLIVGEPRTLPNGQVKTPLSGLSNGFGNWFNGHFWRMAAHGSHLYLGTWDWSVGLQGFSLVDSIDKLFTHQYGFNLYRSEDGVHWTAITETGLGDANNSGVRSLLSTPAGLVIGTARQRYGFEMFLSKTPPTGPLPAPRNVVAASENVVGRSASLTWQPSPGATRYNVYRATVQPLEALFPWLFPSTILGPDGKEITITLADVQSGKFAGLCVGTEIATEGVCAAKEILAAVETDIPASYPLAWSFVGQTTTTTFTEPAPTRLQSIYFVRAVDAQGRLSEPSNLVGAPSKRSAFTAAQCDVDTDGGIDQNDIMLITEAAASGAASRGSLDLRDADRNGKIDVLDSRLCTTKCTKPRCAL